MAPLRLLPTAAILAAVVLAAGAPGGAVAQTAPAAAGTDAPVRVVYHIDDAALQATRALRSLRNHLDVSPDTEIAVVAHADGVDFLLEGAGDAEAGIGYAGLISDLASRGVRFEICDLTLRLRGMTQDRFVLEAEFVESGVVRIAELQTRAGYAYIKP